MLEIMAYMKGKSNVKFRCILEDEKCKLVPWGNSLLCHMERKGLTLDNMWFGDLTNSDSTLEATFVSDDPVLIFGCFFDGGDSNDLGGNINL